MSISIPFGKYRGTLLEDMDPGYLTWMLRKATDPEAWAGIVDFVDTYRDEIEQAIRDSARRDAEAFVVDYELNQGQQAAAMGIVTAFTGHGASMARLDGGAGYGKSFTIIEVVRQLKLLGYHVQACATSYVATQVLSSQLGRIGVEARTIASTIRLAKVEEEDREEYTMTDKTSEALAKLLGPNRVLIVDEDSMVNDPIADAMIRATACGGKLLSVGDVKQLPPVKQSTPSLLTRIEPCFTLTQPMRYAAESDLYSLEQLARFSPETILDADWDGSEQVTVHGTFQDLFNQFVYDYTMDPRADARMLFYRRQDVYNANAKLRATLFGAERSQAEPIIEDERLMVLSTGDVPVQNGEPVRFYSGETFLVERVVEAEVQGVPCYRVTFDNGLTVNLLINVPGSRGMQTFQDRLAELRDEARETGYWGDWRELKNSVLQVGYNYAMTVHRAQGQTVDRVYFAPNMLKGPQAEPLTYVAGTRAKQHVHMLRSAS